MEMSLTYQGTSPTKQRDIHKARTFRQVDLYYLVKAVLAAIIKMNIRIGKVNLHTLPVKALPDRSYRNNLVLKIAEMSDQWGDQ